MRQVILIIAGVLVTVSLVVFAFTYLQVQQEQLELSADLEYRTRLLASGLKESVEPYYVNRSTESLQGLVERFVDRERLLGLAVFDSNGAMVAGTEGLPPTIVSSQPIVTNVMDADEPAGTFIPMGAMTVYAYVEPLHEETSVVGAFMVVQDASYIATNIRDIWQNNIVRLLVQVFVFTVAIVLLVRWVVFLPLARLAQSVKAVRAGEEDESDPTPGSAFFHPLASEISKMTRSLSQARSAASEEARLRLEKLDSPWTAERLKEFTKAFLKDRPLYIVSHIEPFIHKREGREIKAIVPAGGVATALSSVMEACGGTWVAYGGGDADKETADEEGKLAVPPEEPKYTLKRVWLTEKDIKGYYLGFSNEALWPLSHIAHVRPVFRKEDWTAYRRVNGKFAQELLAEIKDVERPIILIQDYHFALLPQMIKKSRPDAQVAFFWHIPWPSPEVFSINPWRKEVLQGILGADVVGFHTQQYCNNFIETVGKELESLIDLEQFSVTHENHTSHIKPFPISIAFTDNKDEIDPDEETDRGVLENLGITTPQLILGVDRLDYTKGILERLRAIEALLTMHPEHRGKVTFLQIASPTREGIDKYQDYGKQVMAETERINKEFRQNGWQPIVLERRQYSHAELAPLYKLADVCLVTSLHDGMNLVSKEFAAARDDEAGVLVLSHFTGASRDLRKGALIVNPYSSEEVGEAVHQGLVMSPADQHRRMKSMRNSIKDYNIYRWSAELIKAAANLG